MDRVEDWWVGLVVEGLVIRVVNTKMDNSALTGENLGQARRK